MSGPVKGPSWAQAAAEYFAAMRAANRSSATIRLHRHYLHYLTDAHADPWSVTLADLRRLIGRDGWGASAMKSARMVFRGFYKWAHGVGYVDEWIGQGLDPVHVPVGLPRPAPELVVKRVQRMDERTVFMAQLGAYAGLRAGEIARVHRKDLRDDLLTVHGKGRKQRIVPIEHEGLLERLERVQGWAFPNRWTGEPLTPGTVTKILSDSMPDGWTAHNLRHRFATSAYDGTSDLLAVAQLLGHASTVTTQVYVQVSANKLRAAVRAAA